MKLSRRIKPVTLTVLVMILLVGSVIHAVPTSAESETVRLTWWMPLQNQSVTDNKAVSAYQYLEKTANVEFTFKHPALGQEAEAFNLLVSGGDLPDMITYRWDRFPGGVEAAAQNNILIRLNDLVDSDMPNFNSFIDKFPEVGKAAKTDNGDLYVFPKISTKTPESSSVYQSLSGRELYSESYCGLIIRKDWLDELGLDVPETLDQFADVLRAFRDQKGADAPYTTLSFPGGDFIRFSNLFYSAFDLCSDFYTDGTNVHYGPYEPAYKDLLTYMNMLYTEKLLDNDFAVTDEASMFSKVLTGKSGAWTGYSNAITTPFDQLHGEDSNSTFVAIGIKNPTKESGQRNLYKQAGYPVSLSYGMGITTASKNPEAAARVVDACFTDEGDFAMNWGSPDNSSVEIVNGWPAWNTNVDSANPADFYKYTAYSGAFAVDDWTRRLQKSSAGTQEGINALTTWDNENGTLPNMMPSVSLASDDISTYSSKITEVQTYVNEMFMKFVMGQESIDKFDSYIAELQSIGIDDLLAMQQAALDRYNVR
ncbi:sugar ABC transporter permease [Clostridia bacterium]|nr:sugar ABC transporter permease [Clostridia bacterium]